MRYTQRNIDADTIIQLSTYLCEADRFMPISVEGAARHVLDLGQTRLNKTNMQRLVVAMCTKRGLAMVA
jgi:hypothetical protein